MGSVLQVTLLLALAPLAQGVTQSVKARLQGRRGPLPWQPYAVALKLLRRQAVWPQGSTAVMRAAPFVHLAAIAVAAASLPLFSAAGASEILLPLFALALARFALGLAALDTGTPFAGLGSSREMTIGAVVEPVLLASLLPWAVVAGSTAWPALVQASLGMGVFSVVRLAAFAAAFLVLVAETGRLPVDNPDTHLELTMIHEAMVLEYSGPPLALILWGTWLKQIFLVALVAVLVFPWGLAGPYGLLWTAGKWLLLLAALGVSESLTAKMRYLRVPAYLATSLALSLSALALQAAGVH
ncbi:MAG: NADH-quinone oxidoreductase subunit H [Thermaerobacter sp.]|nr:NADH-quinone oxidoreductase subunit H [Thermaerobacter sp.]